MTAFALSLIIFSIWSVFGWSLLSALGSRRNLLRNALLSPAMGGAALTLLLFELYRFGLPVRIGGPVAMIAVAVATVVLLRRAPTPVPLRTLLPFLGALLLAAFLTGRPMLQYGFDWVSYCNDDMANYVLLARGELTRGYLSHINPADLLEDRDPGAILWIVSTLARWRNGADLALAWVMSCTGITGYDAFMPTIMAMHLVLVSAGSALVCGGRRYRTAALATCGVLALSSLISLGTLYQLIAQVFGLGLLAAAAALLLLPEPVAGRGSLARRALPGAILVAGLAVCYPEIFPFLAGAFGLYHLLAILRGKESWKTLSGYLVLLGGFSIALLNTYAAGMVVFLLQQIAAGTGVRNLADILFPYFLVPSGLAVFWGFAPLAGQASHPSIDVFISAGALLLAAGVAASLWLAWKGEPAGAIATVMLVLAARLFMSRADFGLFKLAMFLQPFLLPAITLAWFSIRFRGADSAKWTWRGLLGFWVPVGLLAAAGVPTQQYYVRASAGFSSHFVEIPFATGERIVENLKLAAAQPRKEVVLSDTENLVLAKFETPYLTPSEQYFLSEDYFGLLANGRVPLSILLSNHYGDWYANLVRPGYLTAMGALVRERADRLVTAKFDMRGSPANGFELRREPGSPEFPGGFTLAATGPGQTILNRSSEATAPDQPVRLVPSEKVRNHLVLINSDFGRNYYTSRDVRSAGLIAMFHLEPDYFFPNQTMAGIGRILLFQVLKPSDKIRLVLNYTASLKSDSSNLIPPVNAIGDARVAFPIAGRGSARLFSPPLVLQTIQGRHYVSIDMGTDGRKFPEERRGLMLAYGTDVRLDARMITGFARDISAISGVQYTTLRPPSALEHFPNDLRDPSLEYSGIYEDGWVAESSYVRLLHPPQSTTLRIRATIPGLIPQPAALTVVVGERTVAHADLGLGETDLKISVPRAATVQRIELHFDRAAMLPNPDRRPISALLRFIGFEETTPADIADAPITIGTGWYPFEKFGGKTFRWVANDSQLQIHADKPSQGTLAIDLESGPGLAGKPFPIELRGDRGTAMVLYAHGRREVLRAPLMLHQGNNAFVLHISGGGRATPRDPRTLNFRVFSLRWVSQE